MPDNAIDSQEYIKYVSGNIYIDYQIQEINVGEYKEIGNSFNDKEFNPMVDKTDFDINDFKEKVNNLPNDATMQDVFEILGMNNHSFEEKPFENERPMDKPDDLFDNRRWIMLF